MTPNRYIRYGVYALVLIVAGVMRFANPLDTLLDGDSPGYLVPALNTLVNGEFIHYHARSYPYPFFCLLVLGVFKQINAICIVQHILGLGAGIGLFGWMERMKDMQLNGQPAWKKTLVFVLNLVIGGMVLLNGNLINFEKMLRPEGLLLPVMVGSLLILYWYFWGKKSAVDNLKFSGALVVMLISGLILPRFSIGYMLIAIGILIWEIWQRGKGDKRLIRRKIGIFMVVLISIMLPEKTLQMLHETQAEAFKYRQFFASNAYAVRNAVEDEVYVYPDFDSIRLPIHLENVLSQEEKDLNFSCLQYPIDRFQYELVGPDLDSYLEKTEVPYWRPQLHYYRSWTRKLILRYPGLVLHKTFRQLFFIFLRKDFNPFMVYGDYEVGEDIQLEQEELDQYMWDSLGYHDGNRTTISYSWSFTKIYVAFSQLIRFFFLWVILHSAYLLFRKRLSPLYISCLILTLLSFLTIAVTHTFDINRYRYGMTILMVILEYLYLLYLVKNISFKSGGKALF